MESIKNKVLRVIEEMEGIGGIPTEKDFLQSLNLAFGFHLGCKITITKRFVYCEITDGGMEEVIYQFNSNDSVDFRELNGWMSEGCKVNDEKLLKWANESEVGDFYRHRLGNCYRVNVKNK